MNQTPPLLRSILSKFASVSWTTSLARPWCAASMHTTTNAATRPRNIVCTDGRVISQAHSESWWMHDQVWTWHSASSYGRTQHSDTSSIYLSKT